MRPLAATLALGLLLVLAGVGANVSSAQDKAKIIAERQELMKKQGRELVVVRNYFQDKADQPAAVAALESVKKSLPTVTSYFPAGTGIGEVPEKTRAKPEIWREQNKFVADQKKVEEQIATLETAVKSGDKTRVEAVFKEVGFCAGCHDTFRAKEQ